MTPQFRRGKTLGSTQTHSRRAKFHRRFRLFFRFHSASRTIVYAWLNDEDTLRKGGSRTDPYAVFRRMLERGTPPSGWGDLVAASKLLPANEPASAPATRTSSRQAPYTDARRWNAPAPQRRDSSSNRPRTKRS